MTARQTLRIISFLNPREPSLQTDLSWLAVRQVRALLNAGIALQWQIWESPVAVRGAMQARPLTALDGAAAEYLAQHDARLLDLPALMKKTRVIGDADVQLAVSSPEWWAPLLCDAQRRIAYLERCPHWPMHTLARLCASCDEIWLPDAQWAAAIGELDAGVGLEVMPSIRRHRACDNLATDKLRAIQSSLGIAAESFVFLCTLDSYGMQACGHLLAAWEQAFGDRNAMDVALILQCPAQLVAPAVQGGFVDTAHWVETQTARSKHAGIVLIDQHLNVEGEDLLRACAQVFLVTAAGDGLGFRIMDAIDTGNAVLGPAGQGIEALLGPDWQGFLTTDDSQTAALAQALLDAVEHTLGDGPRRTMIQWHVTNDLSEAAFAQRVLNRLPMLQVHA